MSRIPAVNPDTATGELKTIYDGMKKSIGKVPNIFRHMGNSPEVLQSFLALSQSLNHTSLSPKLREQIALVVGQENKCGYCLSAHSAIGKGAGLSDDDIQKARNGESTDSKTRAILHFAKVVVDQRGHVSDADVDALKRAGVSDTELVEIILAIQVNMFTNYFNHIVDPTIDFPLASHLESLTHS
jgi:uncharacterized peroxidase-related enzyme